MGGFSSSPDISKQSSNFNCEAFKIGASSMQGWRETMEDAHIIEPLLTDSVSLFAVFDGHGGPHVARFCADFFVDELLLNESFKHRQYKQALEETFLRMDELVICPTLISHHLKKAGHSFKSLDLASNLHSSEETEEPSKIKVKRNSSVYHKDHSPQKDLTLASKSAVYKNPSTKFISPVSRSSSKRKWKDFDFQCAYRSGCTALVVLITDTQIFCANAGDSRAFLFDGERRVVPLSRDHKPTVAEERERIEKAGGVIASGRINSVLNLSRAIGDLEYKTNRMKKVSEQMISAFPEVRVYDIEKKPLFLIMGCDGIWDSWSAKRICERVEGRMKANPSAPGSAITEELLDLLVAKSWKDRSGSDNMTAILVQFN